MKRNNLGRSILVVCIILWALLEIYPPTSRDLIREFASHAQNRDATFTNIVDRAWALARPGTNSEFAALQEAISTNSIQPYFPQFADAKDQIHPTTFILNRLQRDASGKIKLGLDLQGGTEFEVQMDTNVLFAASTNTVRSRSDETSAALSQAIEVLRKRIDKFGVAEPVIQSAGANQILIQLPGLSPADKALAETNIEKAAYLEFRMVKDDSDEIIANHEPIPPGYELMKHLDEQPGGKSILEQYIVTKKPEPNLAGDIVKNAYVSRDTMGQPQINFELTAAAAKSFAEVTKNNVGRRLAIVLDGDLQTAPRIDEPIEGGSGMIHGSYSQAEAFNIANVLQNPLRAPLSIIYSSDVSPTLGRDTIRSGIRASIAGVAFVSLFMLCYYFLAGLAANVALITNVIIILGVMCSIGATFTLPGIAGGVLTVGMAVDANVLIYERIREELAKGKSLRGAIDAGYARAFGTIFDSHVTTLISSIILIFMGTGEIKGFGVTLTIGVAASLFTALVVTRLIFDFLLNRNWLKSLRMLHIIKSTKINFMQAAKPLFIASWTFAILAVIYGAVGPGKNLFGVDFRGGDSTTFAFTHRIDEQDIRSALPADTQIQYQKDISTGAQRLSVTSPSGTGPKVEQELEQKFPEAQFRVVQRLEVNGSVGAEIQKSAVEACLLSMFGILIYVAFRYEFSFAVGAIVGVLHDVVLTIGCYCIAHAVSGRQFNATVVAAVLTIIGFSLNDKVVIFDRIRENLKLGVRGTFREIINQALNQTLSRTIITSGTVFIATGCLFLFGGGGINDFAFTFLVGILTGTYSSIFIASVFVLWWHKGERPAIGASQVTLQNAATAKA